MNLLTHKIATRTAKIPLVLAVPKRFTVIAALTVEFEQEIHYPFYFEIIKETAVGASIASN